MHEFFIIRQITEELNKHGNVESAEIELGELAPITKEDLFHHLPADYPIDIIIKLGLASCPCGFEGRPKILEREHDFVLTSCPSCSRILSEKNILEGDKIVVKKITTK